MDVQEVRWGGGGGSIDWTDMADGDRWRAVVNEAMNLRIP
jgi:hypothetical protein